MLEAMTESSVCTRASTCVLKLKPFLLGGNNFQGIIRELPEEEWSAPTAELSM